MKTLTVNINKIFEGERRREDYGEIDELVKSIKENGLINPIAVGLTESYKPNHPTVSVPDACEYVLIAGGRRFRACALAGIFDIPVRIYEREMTSLMLRSIELEENIQRKDLSWEEDVKLKKEIHELQVAIHGKKISTAPDAPGHSMRDTAALIGKSHASVSQDVKLAKAIEANPDLPWGKCKSKSEANKMINKLANVVHTDILAGQARKQLSTGSKLAQKLTDSYIVTDAFKAMEKLESGVFNFIECDPPYGIDLTKQKRDYKYEEYHDIEAAKYDHFLSVLCPELYRVMATDSWLVFWFGPEPWFENVFQALKTAGFNVHRMCGIWNKRTGQTNSPETRLANAYEMFFYASKGRPKLNKPGHSNVYDYAPVPPDKKVHPAERPLDLMRDVLRTFTRPNSRVLVPFAGSGVTLEAAADESMIPIGYDLTQSNKDRFSIRVNEKYNSELRN